MYCLKKKKRIKKQIIYINEIGIICTYNKG